MRRKQTNAAHTKKNRDFEIPRKRKTAQRGENETLNIFDNKPDFLGLGIRPRAGNKNAFIKRAAKKKLKL
jgi:hypothetical protein